MSTTAISAVVPRTPNVVAVVAVAAHIRPWVRCNVELSDGTGTIALRFMGRTDVPGVVPGCHLRVEGTPWMEGDILMMLNPLYDSVGEGDWGTP
jgi:hypothetical protein